MLSIPGVSVCIIDYYCFGFYILFLCVAVFFFFFFSSRRRHTRWTGDWSSDVCSSDLSSEKDRRWSTWRRANPRFGEPGFKVRRVRGRVAHECSTCSRLNAFGQNNREIGRASCRERVSISVVAGALKKRWKEGGGKRGA